MKAWAKKAHREIGKMCAESYRQVNQKPDGTWYNRHRPYAVPEVAERLIQCLNEDDEVTAKAIFIYELCYLKRKKQSDGKRKTKHDQDARRESRRDR